LLDVVQVIVERGAAEWVRIYVEKLTDRYLYGFGWLNVNDMDWARLGHLLKELAEGAALGEQYTYQSERRSQWRSATAAGTTTSKDGPPSSAP
jgi:hypothetical protein